MAALVIRQPIPRRSLTPPPQSEMLRSQEPKPGSAPIPNKHLPYCPPGPVPILNNSQRAPVTPPSSPPSKNGNFQPSSFLQPAERFRRLSASPHVYSIEASDLIASVTHMAAQPLPEPKHMFPWLHGLSAENQMQLAFFSVRRRTQRNTPKCFRGMTIVKADGDLTRNKIWSAVRPEEILDAGAGPASAAHFLDTDPKEGFSIRNFQIQMAKTAVVSDIVIYRDEETTHEEILQLAKQFRHAQETWKCLSRGVDNENAPKYNTFVLNCSFESLASDYPSLVAVDSQGCINQHLLDLARLERQEMCHMSQASEVANNVWLGPTIDSSLCSGSGLFEDLEYDIFIETTDSAQVPSSQLLAKIARLSESSPQHVEFPASGSLTMDPHAKANTDPIVRMCKWIYQLANPTSTPDTNSDSCHDADGDIPMRNLPARPRKILIHCTDGYTETTLLGLAYFMYAEQLPLHKALIQLHCDKRRNFFAYPTDIPLLFSIQPFLVPRPALKGSRSRATSLKDGDEPSWLSRMDGSLPSRILPHMYLGNLNHANTPELLKEMGIRRILSVGEPVNWHKTQSDAWGRENVLSINEVQDNGVDSLTKDFDRCLDFIAQGAHSPTPTATLVHCRVGVSRSATICIAAVMSTMHLSFPRAYCYVRARRLNVIIQPHLRFAYELMKWDEVCQARRGEPVRREMDWPTIAREIGALNAPYCRQ